MSFTLDGAFAGIATTNSSGVATLTGVPTSDAAGTDSGGVVASFTGNLAFMPTSSMGDLTVGDTDDRQQRLGDGDLRRNGDSERDPDRRLHGCRCLGRDRSASRSTGPAWARQ